MQKKYFLTNSKQGVSSKSYLLPSFTDIAIFGELAELMHITPHHTGYGLNDNWQVETAVLC